MFTGQENDSETGLYNTYVNPADHQNLLYNMTFNNNYHAPWRPYKLKDTLEYQLDPDFLNKGEHFFVWTTKGVEHDLYMRIANGMLGSKGFGTSHVLFKEYVYMYNVMLPTERMAYAECKKNLVTSLSIDNNIAAGTAALRDLMASIDAVD